MLERAHQLIQKIVTALFPRQKEFNYVTPWNDPDDIPSVTEEEVMGACKRVGNNKEPGLDGIPTSLENNYKSSADIVSRRL